MYAYVIFLILCVMYFIFLLPSYFPFFLLSQQAHGFQGGEECCTEGNEGQGTCLFCVFHARSISICLGIVTSGSSPLFLHIFYYFYAYFQVVREFKKREGGKGMGKMKWDAQVSLLVNFSLFTVTFGACDVLVQYTDVPCSSLVKNIIVCVIGYRCGYTTGFYS